MPCRRLPIVLVDSSTARIPLPKLERGEEIKGEDESAGVEGWYDTKMFDGEEYTQISTNLMQAVDVVPL